MNTLRSFRYHHYPLRVIKLKNRAWFIGSDVARILGYKQPNKALYDHIFRSDLKILKYRQYKDSNFSDIWKNNDFSNKIITNQAGIFSLMEASRLPQSMNFRYWINHYVLPNIYNKGFYVKPGKETQALRLMVSYYKHIPKHRALMIASKAMKMASKYDARLIRAKHRIKRAQPELHSYRKYVDNPDLINTTVIAKDFGLSAYQLNRILVKHHVIYRQSHYWVLYRKYQNKDLAHYKFYPYSPHHQSSHLAWTPKGRIFIFNLLNRLQNAGDYSDNSLPRLQHPINH